MLDINVPPPLILSLGLKYSPGFFILVSQGDRFEDQEVCMRYYLLFCIFLIIFIGCGPKKQIKMVPKSPLEIGDYLWEKGEYISACENYEKALYNYLVPKQRELSLIQRIIKCSLQSKNLVKAKLYLDKWKSIDPTYLKKWQFHKHYLTYLDLKNEKQKYYQYLIDLIKKDLPLTIRKNSFILLELSYLKDKDINNGRAIFDNYYNTFNSREQYDILNDLYKSILEENIATKYDLENLDPAKLPDSLIMWAKILCLLSSKKISWSKSYMLLQNILNKNSLLKELFLDEFKTLIEKNGIPRIELVLVLPFDPLYEQVSYEILTGVEAAIYEMEGMGVEAKVVVLNSNASGWIDRLKEIASKDLIVGGFIKLETFNEILKTDLSKKIHLFAFRSYIPKEGVDGFRFFPSHKDQVTELIKFSMDKLQIDSFAIFYPRSDYGRNLGEEFFNEARLLGAKLTQISWYDPENTRDWQEKVGNFLDVPKDLFQDKDDEKIKGFKPDIDFSAVFIPDSFENSRIIIPYFFYYNASDLYFLGPALWGSFKPEFTPLEISMFKRAYYPSPWIEDNNNNQLINLKKIVFDLSKKDVNFWICLGYDFFRYAAYLKEHLKNGQLIDSILNNPEFKWTIGPIKWDEKGIASQHMFVLRIY